MIAFAVLMLYTARIADPTAGGISRSEVLEGIVPGDLNSLLIVWAALVFIAVLVWVLQKKHQGEKFEN